MQVGDCHLGYCTNIHAAAGWHEVFQALQRYVPALKRRLSPERPFGLGLRLSAAEADTLLRDDALAQFQDFLRASGAYVFTLNGFPYGAFHGRPVKARVFAPDWRDEARVRYTLCLARILAALLPPQVEGSISTVPLSYKAWIGNDDRAALAQMSCHLARVAAALVQLGERQACVIYLALEPEPDGVLAGSRDVVAFYQNSLLPVGGRWLAQATGVSRERAEAQLLEHVRVCWDTCHLAVQFEEPAEVLLRFQQHGIQVGKLQISSALKVLFSEDGDERRRLLAALDRFAESTYLHQVVECAARGERRGFPDLPHALAAGGAAAREWRVHVHVPLFAADYAGLLSTRSEAESTLRLLQKTPFTRHLEIETYTWEVLPGAKPELTDSIEREYRWVLSQLASNLKRR